MFTGIIEATASVVAIRQEGSNYHFTLTAPFASELRPDQSVAHDGCCRTIVSVDSEKQQYTVTAMNETMQKTCLCRWRVGNEVNVERAMLNNGRLDGHIVQGHVDQTATCTAITTDDGSWRFTFEYDYDTEHPRVTVSKGSIAVNGVSLTVVDSIPGRFSVAIIPYTYQHTNFHNLIVGSIVNIEFDILGKYIERYMETIYGLQNKNIIQN